MVHPRTQSRPLWQRPTAHHAFCAPLEDTRPTVTRMAETMRDQNAEGGCTTKSLLQAGFTEHEIILHADDAALRAQRLFMGAPEPIADDSDLPIAARMRVAIGEMFPSRQFIVTDLMGQGFSKAQIDLHLATEYRHTLKDAGSAISSHTGAVQ